MRQYLSAMLWITATTVIVASAQVVTTRAAAERRAVTKLNIDLVDNKVRIRELEAEMRTRAGMPEMQRWNDAVFQMAAPQSGQILRSPVQLAAFAAQPDAVPNGLPRVQMAVAVDAPLVAETPLPVAETGPRVLKTSFGVPAASADPGLPAATTADVPPVDPAEPRDGGE